jgi:hypothetical protein
MPDSAAEEAEAKLLALVLENVSGEVANRIREDRDASGEATPLIVVYSAAHGVAMRALP